MCCSVLQREMHTSELSACVPIYMLQRVAVCCSVLQCVAVCCSELQREMHTSELSACVHIHMLQCVAVCCSVLQYVAARDASVKTVGLCVLSCYCPCVAVEV